MLLPCHGASLAPNAEAAPAPLAVALPCATQSESVSRAASSATVKAAAVLEGLFGTVPIVARISAVVVAASYVCPG